MSHEKYTACLDVLLPLQDTLDVIGGKWKLKIILSIWDGNHRFKDILKSIPNLSSKVLANDLKDLEIHQLIKRRVDQENSMLVYYSLDSYSDTLIPIINQLVRWGQNHRQKLFNNNP